jgi:hypothetical protein
VEGRLAGAYVAAKAAVLDDRLEELLFMDAGAAGLAPLPAGVRGAAMELANCLVRGPAPWRPPRRAGLPQMPPSAAADPPVGPPPLNGLRCAAAQLARRMAARPEVWWPSPGECAADHCNQGLPSTSAGRHGHMVLPLPGLRCSSVV